MADGKNTYEKVFLSVWFGEASANARGNFTGAWLTFKHKHGGSDWKVRNFTFTVPRSVAKSVREEDGHFRVYDENWQPTPYLTSLPLKVQRRVSVVLKRAGVCVQQDRISTVVLDASSLVQLLG